MPVVNVGKHALCVFKIDENTPNQSGVFCLSSEGFSLYINSKDPAEFRNFANSLLQLATDMESTNEPS